MHVFKGINTHLFLFFTFPCIFTYVFFFFFFYTFLHIFIYAFIVFAGLAVIFVLNELNLGNVFLVPSMLCSGLDLFQNLEFRSDEFM